MGKDKLKVGFTYWLDVWKDTSGKYCGNVDGEILFKKVSGDGYLENKNGFISFSELDKDFYLVSKTPVS